MHAYPLFSLFTITYKVTVYAPAERAETSGTPTTVRMPETAETQTTSGTQSAAGTRTLAETPASSRKARMGRKVGNSRNASNSGEACIVGSSEIYIFGKTNNVTDVSYMYTVIKKQHSETSNRTDSSYSRVPDSIRCIKNTTAVHQK